MPASNNLSNSSFKFEVLLDIGSHSNSFSYLDGNKLGVEVGDIVSVRLKGRLLNGLAIAKNPFLKIEKYKKKIDEEAYFEYLFIENIVEKKVIQDWWREWLESLASFYRVSNLKMFKTAFPPGWIGKHKKISLGSKDQVWIEIKKKLDIKKIELTNKEFLLTNTLSERGNWQSELIKAGFNYSLIDSMVRKNYLCLLYTSPSPRD